MSTLTKKLEQMPAGTAALFLIQIFSTLSYAVLYSSLVLFMTTKLGLKEIAANTIMGGFIAFNYSLHLLGGYFGGRLLSYRNLFVYGMCFQVIGCFLLSTTTIDIYYWGLSCFLVGAGLNVTCVNMMLTQLFKPEDTRRETAFLWNYSGMNIGFFLGFAMGGYYHLQHDYTTLFILSGAANALAIILSFINWKNLKDKESIIAKADKKSHLLRAIAGFSLILAMTPLIHWCLLHASFSNDLILGSGIVMAVIIFVLALQQPTHQARNKMLAYLVLTLASMVFWTLYQLAPMGLTVFAHYNVQRHYFGIEITPQWIQNINTVVIVFGGPLMVKILADLRNKGYKVAIPWQFSLSLILIGSGFILIPVGILFADHNGMVAFPWLGMSYVLQSIGELLISPIGFAMIGRLAPVNLQGILMGTWMMTSGVAGILSSYFSNMAIAGQSSTAPLVTNPGYAHTFNELGWGAIIAAILLVLMVPRLKQLMQEQT